MAYKISLSLLIVLLCSGSTRADFTVVNNSVFFNDAISNTDSQLAVVEGYENNNLENDNSWTLEIAPFQAGVPLLNPDSGFGFPDGLSTDLMVMNPLGNNINTQWNVTKGGFLGGPQQDSVMLFADGIDFTLLEPDVTAFQMNLTSLSFADAFQVQIFSGQGNLVYDSPFDPVFNYFGVVADGGDTISRVVITPDSVGFFDDVAIWNTSQIPEPSSLIVMMLAATLGLTRRRG